MRVLLRALLAIVLVLAVVPVVLSAVRADPPTLDELGDPTEGRLAYAELMHGRDTVGHLDPEGGGEVYLPLDDYGLNNALHAEYRGGVLVFASDLPSETTPRREIFALIGGEIVQLTDNGSTNQNPAVSPDGQWVAYEHFDTEDSVIRIRLVRTDGTDDHELAGAPDYATWPSWSPGSDAVAYAAENRVFRLQAFDEAAVPVQLTDFTSGQPAWGDEGYGEGWIAFVGSPGEGAPQEVMEIPDELCENEGGFDYCDPYRPLQDAGWEDGGAEPAYTPTGIAFSSYSNSYTSVYLFEPSGGEDIGIAATIVPVAPSGKRSTHPTWLGDAGAVGYATELHQGRIWTSLPDGTDPVRHSEPLPHTLDDEPAYSPDGRRLAYAALMTDEFGQDMGGAIRIDDLDDPTAAPVMLQPAQYEYYGNPAFSPDGRFLAAEHWFEFGGSEFGNPYISEIVVFDLEDPSAPVRRLPHAETVNESAGLYASVDSGPSWSPEGTQLVFARSWEYYGSAGESEEYPPLPYDPWASYLHVIDAQFAEAPRRITFGTDEVPAFDWGPAWSPVDAGHIVFSRDSDLWTVDPTDCDGPAEDPCANAAIALAGDLADMDLSSPAFSPDGTMLAVTAGYENNPTLAAAVAPLAVVGPDYLWTTIWTVPASGGEGRQVTEGAETYRSYDSAAWQPTSDMALHIEPDPGTVLLGDESTVTITVSNLGRAASAATVGITLPSGLSLVTAPANCSADGTTCELETMATRTQTQIALVVRGDVLGEQPIDAVVTPTAVDPDPTNNAAATSITVDPRPDEPSTPPPTTPPPGPARLRIAADVEPTPGYVGGADLVVTFTVTNTAPVPATSVQLTVTLPEELPVVDAPAGCTAGSPCDIGTLPSGTSLDVVFTLSPDAALDDVVAGTAATAGAAPATDDAPIIVLQPAIEVNPGLGPPGRPALVTGQDFPPGAHVAISLDGGLNTQSTEVVIASDGTFSTSLLVLVHEQLGPREVLAEPVSGPAFGPVDTPFLVVPGGLDPPDFIGRR